MNATHVRTHKPAPIEVDPSEDGNISVTGSKYEVVPKEERQKYKDRGFVLRKNHFATCAYAASFAKPKPAPRRKAIATSGTVIRGPWEKFQN